MEYRVVYRRTVIFHPFYFTIRLIEVEMVIDIAPAVIAASPDHATYDLVSLHIPLYKRVMMNTIYEVDLVVSSAPALRTLTGMPSAVYPEAASASQP
jgi:hypothetical protein